MKKVIYRIYQSVLRVFAYLIKFPEPKIISGEKANEEIASFLKKNNKSHPLLVSGNTIYSLGMCNPLEGELKKANISYEVFHNLSTNPTIKNVLEGLDAFKNGKCDSIIALGGGSVLDTAKIIGALYVKKSKNVEKLKGVLKVGKKIPFMIAIPTTAGTGSETTIAAVVINEETNHKYAISDPHLVPDYAVMDPNLLVNLPSKVTAATSMDALTHAVEAYLGRSNTKRTTKVAKESISLIHEYMPLSYKEPKNLLYREKMLYASYLAGLAITRAYVGYVHAIAHSLGGKYEVSHGEANAIILPYVLESYGNSIYKKIAVISDNLSLCEKDKTNKEKTEAFISWIREQNVLMGIPTKFDIEYCDKDVDEMIKNAIKEANPFYPVPRILGKEELKEIYKKVLK